MASSQLVQRTAALVASTAITAALCGVPAGVATAHAGDGTSASGRVEVKLRAAVRQLPLARETRMGYDRDKFHHWVDANGDCQDTRDEVLDAESRVQVSGCDITSGRWFSYYDGATWRQSGDVDIDHMVPLAEAWDSGAKRWNAKTRERYANDLGDRRSLVAVTDNVNSSKSDQDIAEWLPDRARCRYLREWTVVKSRWSLRVDRSERRAMRRMAGNCHNDRLHFTTARIALR